MIADRLRARSFRSYERLDVPLGERVTVVTGDNGAGKTNLLEALYTSCVGRSCRTRIDAQTVRFDQPVARVELEGHDEQEDHTLAVAIDRKEGKTFFADGARVESFEDFTWRPPVAVFMPDRLELVKGAPGVRRAHLDQLVAALWPARRGTRRSYAEALAQRNALLARGGGSEAQMDTWDRELAAAGLALMENRRSATSEIEERFVAMSEELGLTRGPALRYRPSAGVETIEQLVQELRERRADDLARGFSTYGPHRDEIVFTVAKREVRTYGSQGQQRLTLLALLLAECEAIAAVTARRPLILLDDVTSELDATRRHLLVDRVARLGQVLITTTEREHVPAEAPVDVQLAIAGGTATVV
ncbi:MAG: DNA replication and repair protein RecF [Actinobacteria bacterium]|nr:DNA replication and repair protein RecF [Actinomycetota bacterium]